MRSPALTRLLCPSNGLPVPWARPDEAIPPVRYGSDPNGSAQNR
jgi:hypothetical protein